MDCQLCRDTKIYAKKIQLRNVELARQLTAMQKTIDRQARDMEDMETTYSLVLRNVKDAHDELEEKVNQYESIMKHGSLSDVVMIDVKKEREKQKKQQQQQRKKIVIKKKR